MTPAPCTCTMLTPCPEAERLHKALIAAGAGPDSHAATLAYTRHRAPFSPPLRELLPRLEAR